MRRALVLITIAMLAAACGKKQAPTGVQSPAPEETKDVKSGEGEGDAESMPRTTNSDPCEGGENKKAP
jgi:hypothetical protein